MTRPIIPDCLEDALHPLRHFSPYSVCNALYEMDQEYPCPDKVQNLAYPEMTEQEQIEVMQWLFDNVPHLFSGLPAERAEGFICERSLRVLRAMRGIERTAEFYTDIRSRRLYLAFPCKMNGMDLSGSKGEYVVDPTLDEEWEFYREGNSDRIFTSVTEDIHQQFREGLREKAAELGFTHVEYVSLGRSGGRIGLEALSPFKFRFSDRIEFWEQLCQWEPPDLEALLALLIWIKGEVDDRFNAAATSLNYLRSNFEEEWRNNEPNQAYNWLIDHGGFVAVDRANNEYDCEIWQALIKQNRVDVVPIVGEHYIEHYSAKGGSDDSPTFGEELADQIWGRAKLQEDYRLLKSGHFLKEEDLLKLFQSGIHFRLSKKEEVRKAGKEIAVLVKQRMGKTYEQMGVLIDEYLGDIPF